MQKEDKYGTGWSLQLRRGDLVEIANGIGSFTGPPGVLVGIVAEGPKDEKSPIIVLLLFSDDKRELETVGTTLELWHGFANFRRLVPAVETISVIPAVIKALSRLKL